MRILESASVDNNASQESERLGILERMVKSIFERLQAIEERLEALEKPKARKNAAAAPKEIMIPMEIVEIDPTPETKPELKAEITPEPAPAPISLSTPPPPEISTQLFGKMWKYLNDKK